jgi:hypothetical protein
MLAVLVDVINILRAGLGALSICKRLGLFALRLVTKLGYTLWD